MFSCQQAILRNEVISRLVTKLEMALLRNPLDIDFLEFTCRQELYLWEALSRHVTVDVELIQALREFLRLVMECIEVDEVSTRTPETLPSEMGRPKYNIEEERLLEFMELNMPLDYIARILRVSAREKNEGVWSLCKT